MMKRAHCGSPIFLTLLSCFFLLLPRHVAAASKLLPLASRDRTVEAGETAMLSVQVVDEAGRPRKGVGVKFRIVLTPMMADGAGISGSAVSTDSKGIARVKLTTSSPGTYQVTATNRALLGSPIVFTVRAKPSKRPAPPSRVEIPSVPPPSIPLPQTQLPSPVLPRITVAPNPAPALVVAKGVRENAGPNEPKTLILYAPVRKWLAGSPEKVPVKFKIFDAEGHLLAGNFLVSVEGDGLLVEGKDADERREGLQIRPVGGVGEVKVRAGAETGEGSLVARVVGTGKGEEEGEALEAKLGFSLEMGEAVGVEAEPREVHGRAGEVVAIKAYLVDRYGNRRGVEGRVGVTGEWGVVKGEGVELRRAGRHEAWVRAEGFEVRVPVEVEAGEAVKVEVIMLGEARVGGEAQIVGKVTDEYGNLVSRGEVIFEAEGEGWGVHPSRVRAGGDGKYYAVVQVGRGPQGVVRARAGQVRGEARIEALPGQIAQLQLGMEGGEVEAGGKIEVRVEGRDRYGDRAGDGEVLLSASRGRVSQKVRLRGGEGVVEYWAPKEAGQARIEARAGEARGEAEVVVRAGAVKRVGVRVEPGEVEAGGRAEVRVEAWDAYGNRVEDGEVEVGASGGEVTGKGELRGEGAVFTYEAPTEAQGVRVWAEVGGVRGEAQVVVKAGELAGIRVEPQRGVVRAGQERQVRVVGWDRYGNERGVSGAVWRVEGEGEVRCAPGGGGQAGREEACVFTGTRVGQAQVVAQVGELRGEGEMEVRAGAPAHVDIEVLSPQLRAGEWAAVRVRVTDRYGNVAGQTPVLVRLRGEEPGQPGGVQRVVTNEAGLADVRLDLPKRAGPVRVEVTAASSGVSVRESIDLVVGPQREKVTHVAVREGVFQTQLEVDVAVAEPAQVEMITAARPVEGEEVGLVLKVTDRFGNLVPTAEILLEVQEQGWAVLPRKVYAGRDGKYYATLRVGRGPAAMVKATVRAGEAEVAAQQRIEAAPGPVAALRLVPNRLTVQAGGYAELMVEAAGLFGGVPRPERVEVRADRGSTHAGWLDIIAGKGKVIYKAPEEVGNDTLSVRSGKLQVAAVITVVAGDPARIELSPAAGAQGEAGKPQVPAGGQMPIRVKVLDAFGNPLEATEVSFGASRGRFEGARRRRNALDASAGAIYEAPKEAGPVLLWAQAGQAKGDLKLEVVPGELIALRVHPSQLTLRAGEEHVFEAYGKDRYGNEGPVKVDWRAEMIGQMDRETGLFRVRRTGQGRVVAQAGSLSAKAQVTVEPGPPVDIEVRAGEAKAGEPLSVSAVVRDAFGNPVGGVPVVCQASAEDYEFEPLRTLTGDEGVAEFLIQMPPRAGKVSIEVTSPHIPQRASAD